MPHQNSDSDSWEQYATHANKVQIIRLKLEKYDETKILGNFVFFYPQILLALC
jgi:hypothetical protein